MYMCIYVIDYCIFHAGARGAAVWTSGHGEAAAGTAEYTGHSEEEILCNGGIYMYIMSCIYIHVHVHVYASTCHVYTLHITITVPLITLQARHRDEIEQIRKAGHDTLAIIVEQYKVTVSTCGCLRVCVCACTFVVCV